MRRLESAFGLAVQLAGSASLYGDWRTTFRLEDRLRAVTAGDVQLHEKLVSKFATQGHASFSQAHRDPAGSPNRVSEEAYEKMAPAEKPIIPRRRRSGGGGGRSSLPSLARWAASALGGEVRL